ncbi:TIGR00153 family protein [Gammaproteobacteria bacterium]|nr:TIGR00153 family protein [Gammaproteobacteria bacterium]
MPSTPFLDMFGRSPIRPLEEHMAKVNACVKKLHPFFEEVISNNWDAANSIHQDIVFLENEADNMKRELRLHLPNSLFMSFSRTDLLELLEIQDELANKSKDIAGMVFGRKMTFPEALSCQYIDFLKSNIEASNQANKVIHELDELFETGFSGNEMKIVESMVIDLSDMERKTDDSGNNLRNVLFELEKSMPPVDVMFTYKLIDWTGGLADCAQEIGDHLQILLAK